MKSKALFWPVTGTLALGVFIGACSQRTTNNTPLERTANAQAIRNADDLQRLSTTYAAIAQKVTPAVVNITSERVIPGRVFRDPFDFYGGSDGMMREPDQRRQSLGSGVLVDERGIIITNNHVVQNASSITVTLSDKRRFPAKLMGTDPASDVAALKIDAPNLPVMQWADSDKVAVGDIVLAVGSPFNLSSTVTQGIISAKGRRDLGISLYEDFLQTDAAINQGNSGGALVDINGNLIGINTAILSEGGGNNGIGLAIPASLARKVSGQLVASGKVVRGWVGMIVEPVTDDIANRLKLARTEGVVVTGIYTNGPAGRLPWSEAGDIILKANGTAINTPGQLRNMVADLAPGSTLTLDVWQGGQTRSLKVTVGTRPQRVQGV